MTQAAHTDDLVNSTMQLNDPEQLNTHCIEYGSIENNGINMTYI